MQFLFAFMLLVVLPTCFTAPGIISFGTTQTEVEEKDYEEVRLKTQRSGGSNGTVRFICTILNSTRDDFHNYEVDGTFEDGKTSSTCVFYVKDDLKAEGNETLVVKLSLPQGSNSSLQAPSYSYIKIIANDDAYGVVGFDVPNTVFLNEPRTSSPGGGGVKRLSVRRHVGAFGSITVNWKIVSPKANSDITPTSGMLKFVNSEANKSLEFYVRNDTIIEQDEDFIFELTSVIGGARLNSILSQAVVTILANDIPVRFALNQIAVPENQSEVVVWIYRGLDQSGTRQEASVDNSSSVSWYLRSGIAMGNHDFNQTNGTIVFGKGETKKSVTIRILEDNVPEVLENFTVQLTNLSPDISLAPPSVCTILILPSDDHAGVFKLPGDDVIISEDGGNNYVNLTIERAAGKFGRVEVTWRATSSIDNLSKQVQPTNGSVFFDDGVQYQLVNIFVTQDMEPEKAFSFVVELTRVTGGRLTEDPLGRTQEVKVQDSDDVYGIFEFADDLYQTLTLTSSSRMVHFMVNRHGGSLGTVMVGYEISYLLPNGSDRTSTINISSSGSVSMVSGQRNASVSFIIPQKGFIRANAVFRILLTNVTLLEPAKTLLPPQTPRFGARQSLNLTVNPQFADGEIGFEKTSVTVTEPDGVQPKEIKISVLRDGTLYGANLLWSIVGVRASTDVSPIHGSIAFEKGVDSVNITIQILPDSIPELDETFTLQLHNVSEVNQNLQPGSSELVLTILRNDNPEGTFQFSNVKSIVVQESTGSGGRFSVDVIRLGGDLDERFVDIVAINGTDDFVPAKKILRFVKGERKKTETFDVRADDIPEADKTFTFSLVSSGPAGKQGRLGNLTAFNVTILASDDANGIIVFLNTSLSVVESKGDHKGVHFYLERQRGLFGDVAIFWNATSNEDPALDISPVFGRVEFADGERLKTLQIFSQPDNVPEDDENFTMTLIKVEGGAKIGSPSQATLTVLRNDDAIEFAAPTHVRIREGETASFTILRKGRHGKPISVNYTTKDGSASSSDRDYVATSQQVSFAIGEVEKRISVSIPDDNKPESDENFTIALTSSTGDTAIYGNTVAIVTIAASDDPNGIFHFDGNSVLNKTVKEQDAVNFRVIRDRGIFGTVNVLWQIYQIFPNGSRVKLTSGEFKQTSGALVFQNGTKTKDLKLEVLSDELAEYEEQFEVVLFNITGGHPGPGGEISENFTVAVIRIPTNDNPYGLFAFGPKSLDVSVAEDTRPGFQYEAKVNLTVLRKRGRDRNVSVSWCIYSKIGDDNLGHIWDLVFLSQIVGPGVHERHDKKRPNTGSKVLEFTGGNDSYAIVNTKTVLTKEMTISAWIKPERDMIGTIVAKVTTSSIPYKLVIDTKGNIILRLEIHIKGPSTITASTDVTKNIFDDSLHNIMVSIDGGKGVQFYCDGDHIGTNSSLTFGEMLDEPGDWYLGASRPNKHPFKGFLQDVKIFSKALKGSVAEVIAKPVSDLKPINGYLSYPQEVTSHVVSIETVDNTITEDEKVFSMILTSSSGGADIDDSGSSKARLTVLKSDNANGLFAFSSGQKLSKTVNEAVGNISVVVTRTLSSRGQVTVEWEIVDKDGVNATKDFVSAFGRLVFIHGEVEKNLTVSVRDDTSPELLERFTLRLVSAQSNDGKKESAPRSGASINPGSSECFITIVENDAPYGLLQFSASPPRNGSIVALTEVFRLKTRESVGILKLYVVRAQGVLGTIDFSWKIVAGTAIAGTDYRDGAGEVTLGEGETNASIAITLIDNNLPELNKTFYVQLYDAKKAQIGRGGVAVVTILPSDDAFGVVNFTSSSLVKIVHEGQNVKLQLQRTGGALGPINIFWEVNRFGDDFWNRTGQVFMDKSQRSAFLTLTVKKDLLPELSESFLLRLVNVSNGRLASSGIVANITVLANDDPHGVFEFDPVLLSVEEADRNVTLTITRRRGTVGKTRVYYTSVPSSVLVEGLKYERANETQDYASVEGFVNFQPNQTSGSVVVRIMDDVIPEDNETVVVNLTSVVLISDTIIRPGAVGSPRIGTERLGQVVILRNDNASGIIRLSSSAVTVREGDVGSFLSVVRGFGTFGEVKVDIEVTPSSAKLNKDYHVNLSTITIPDGERTAIVPISIINDEDPEFDEIFIVRLLSKGPDGTDVLVGFPAQCTVTIEENDYPYGLIGFSDQSMNKIVTEPSSGDQVVTLDVIREYGTRDVAKFHWVVTHHGRLAINDVKQTKGEGLIPPSDNKTSFNIFIMADNVPEVNEVLLVTLNITQGKAKVNPERAKVNVTIRLNDDAHGVVEFAQDSYTVIEKDQNTVANISIVRKRGTFGDVRVFYSTLQGSSSSSAIPNYDYIPASNDSATILDGSSASAVSIVIIGDFTPEFGKSFKIILESVELINSVGSSKPRIGPLSQANISIEDDDHVYGLFKVFAIDPKDCRNRSRVVVNETDGLVITFVIQRYGGNRGVVTVQLDISESTARATEDFGGSGSTLTFNHGDRRREFLLTIAGDNIPERDEMIIVKLVNPAGGADVAEGTGNNATVVILANDVVAGKIGFSALSRAVVVNEGQVVVLSVIRTFPAAGRVTVEWIIQGDNVTKDFNQTNGFIQFEEGQNVTFIKTLVLADNTSEVDEQFQVILRNPVTSDVSWTGAAEINDRTKTATLTIAASNEPYGVLEFQQSSRQVTVEEDEKVLKLSVARLYGNIGTIRLHFTIINGSIQHLGSDERLSTVDNDVTVDNSSISIGNGVGIGIIPINIINDNLAELNEYFIVNLTSVELVLSSSSSVNNRTLISPRLGRYLTSEVKITANDGPYGILVFSPSRVRVLENITVFNLTVLRTQGTHGDIQVHYFIRRRNIQENDFHVYGSLEKGGENTLDFVEGQRSQNITVFVYDDSNPEGDETFEVWLKTPSGGAQLAGKKFVEVTILVSDGGNGIFTFDAASLHKFVDEPGTKIVGTTKGRFTILRENGTIGVVVIGWSVRNDSARMDLKTANGTVLFRDGETKKSFTIETVVDIIPEKKEKFLVVLSVLSGGGEVMPPSEAWLTVSENDEPYGEFGFAVSPNVLTVEETVRFTELRVIRHKGTYGQVTVNYQTTSKTADGSIGPVMKFGIFQSFSTRNATTWYPFSAYGEQYLLLGASNGSIHGNHGNAPSYTGSSLFRWQGIYTHVSEIETNNAVQWESFSINDQYYVAVANHGMDKNHEVNSTIYKLYLNGSTDFHQNIFTQAASDVKFFKPSGSSSCYLIFSNMKNNAGNTVDVFPKVYVWSNGRFIPHGRGLNCRGASGLALFTINGHDMLSISSFYDSVNNNYQSQSVIFEWKNQKFESILEITTNGATGVEYFKIDGDHFLLFVNSRVSPSLYKWSGTTFLFDQNVPVSNTKTVKEFTMHGEVFFAVTSLYGNSQLLKWNSQKFQFYTNITASGAVDVQPITLQDPVVHNVSLLAIAMTGSSQSTLLQPAMVSPQADYIPRGGQLIFEDGDRELSIFITIFNDSVSEPDESFLVSLSNATGGSIVGPGKELEVNILSNGNPYGRIGFSKKSVYVIVEERRRDSKVYLEVLREQGKFGDVVVAWNSTGNATGSHGDSDVFPTSGEVVFLEGETKKTINLTIVADDIPEVNEVLFLKLTYLKKDGSDLPTKGASINTAQDMATVLIQSNDEPHGIVGWRRTVVLAQESEAINSTVQLVIERGLGTFGDIEIAYRTVEAKSNSSFNERPAVPYQDFVPAANRIVMADGVNISTISINVIHDDNAEINEIFFVNITNVRLLHSYSLPSGDSPRISFSGQTAKVVISENDDKRGEFNFDVTHLLDPRTGILRINENIGVLSLRVVRSSGMVGRVGFEYRLVPETRNKNDYFPTKGQIIFLPNVTTHVLEINITDDSEAEVAERFRVEMTQPIGGAKLGNDREVSVEIRASDQPYGVFEFSGPSTLTMEEGGVVLLTVARLQGRFRQVHVQWNLSVGAFPDVYPANGTLTFDDNVTSQVIKLKARDDSIPEGVKIYVCNLVSADNGGVLGSENKVTLRIDVNDDGYGVMAIDPGTSFVFVGEPDLPSYNGEVTVSVVRNVGTYGEVLVEWEITSDDLVAGKTAETFNETRGNLVFGDGVKVRNVTLRVKQDSYPEETGNYTFSLTGTRDTRIDRSASKATVVVVSSDHPYGILEFVGNAYRNLSEDVGQVTLNVVRDKGHTGRLLVTINVVENNAIEGRDFQIAPKVLTIEDKQDYGSLNVTILPEAVPELSESFTVSLGNIQLVTSKPVNYGYKNGLQVDMPPVVGKRDSVVITILKNDDAHGVIEFKESQRVVHEHDGSVVISVIRSGGTFGKVQASYTVTNFTAQYGKDYLISDGTVTLGDGEQMVNLTIQLLDDELPEDKEEFQLQLTSVDGGARLGERKAVLVVIETSDNPDGLFGFMNQTRLTLNNPNATKLLKLGVFRIGGARSSVEVKIRVFKTFPNHGPVTADVSPDTKDLTFAVNQFGPKIFELTIKPFIDQREVEEHFIVAITGVSGNASIDSLTSNVTVIILKHGMPNGLFGFESLSTQTVSESRGSPVLLTVRRREGREGTAEVKWMVLGPAGAAADFTNNKGTLVFYPGDERKQISLTIVDDKVPELNEDFTITLLAATGGGDIDMALSNATVTIRANDNPHGAFRLRPKTQSITVEENLSRTLSFTVERIGGKFGEVKVSYSLEYSKEKSKGYVTIGNDKIEKTHTVIWNAFLFPDSHFTLTLTDVSYQGSGVSEIPPTLVSGGSTENIQVPDSAANSIVKFKDGNSTLLVNQDNQVSRIFVSRRGFYGNVTVFINNGFPSGKYSGFTKGLVKPSVSQITFAGNEVEKEFSAKVYPVLVPNGRLVYAVNLSRVSTPSNVRGRSKIDKDGAIAVIEAGGVVVVAMASQNIVVKENQTVSITVYRLFSSLGTINVIYSTQSSTATPNKDYVEKLSSRFSMLEGEYRKVLNIDIKNDEIPELDETFDVKITGVTGANARLGDNSSSTITIEDDDSPYGILFFAVDRVSVFENSTTVHVVISRAGGTFGNVGVQVRTVGGGESWNAGNGVIENILAGRNKSSVANVVSDYDSLDNQVNFPNEVPTPSQGQNQTVTLTIINDDTPERDEDIYLYMSNPSGGAVLASPSTGKRTWTVVQIKGNDLMNGKIGFKTTSLTMNEDKDLNGEIIVERAPSLGTAKVEWKAFNSGDNLERSAGTIVFHPNEASTKLLVQLKNDNDPELKMNFTLELVSLGDTLEATIDVAKSVVYVTILDSDDPRGLIAFDQDSRNVAVDVLSENIELNVVREQGLNDTVNVSYKTTMLSEPYKDGGLEINRAIEDKDYIITQGALEFKANMKTSINGRIVIELKRESDASSSYPKAFSVTLYNIVGGARLDDRFSTAIVIINNKQSTAQFLKLRSESLKTPLSDSKMTSVVQSLLDSIKQTSLSDIEISIVTNVMNNILDDIARRPEEKKRKLTKLLSDSFINIFNFLLNPEREDFRGKTQFTEPFVKYAFSLVHGQPCPDTSVVRQSRTFATVEGRRRLQSDVNGLILASSSDKNSFTYPSNIYPSTNQTSLQCEDIHFIEYHTSHWFNKDNKKDILNDRVLSTSLKNTSETNLNKGSSVYRIYTGERRVTPKGAECLKWSYDKGSWDNTICSVKKESDDFVECECRHFSNFAIRAQSDDRVGYQFYFYIAAFICMISFFLVIFSHHVCSMENTFSSKLLMHMFFAGFVLHLLVIVAAYVTPELTDKPTGCATLGILIHYFLLAHFCWIFVQCCNLWRILVLNDEQTDRKFILFFMMGWGIPLVFIALYIVITHALYGWNVTDMYADVHNNGDMCFIKNAYGGLTSVLAPVLLFLLGVCVVASQAYQVTLQWKLYDDIFREHHNIKEVIHLWVVFVGITLTWLFGGLHLAYGKLWLAILFSIFELLTGLYVFMVYFVLRNQCRRKYKNEAYLLNASSPSMFNGSPNDYYAERPVMGDAQSVQSSQKSDLRLSSPDGNEWHDFEYDGTTPKGSRRGLDDAPFAQLNPIYDDYHGKKQTEMNDENMDDDEELSQDFSHLIEALKTGETREVFAKEEPLELKVPESVRTDKLELRRVTIADTHV